MERMLYLLSTAATECFFKPSSMHKTYTNIYKTTKFAGQWDDSEGDNHNKIACLMDFHRSRQQQIEYFSKAVIPSHGGY